MGIIKSRKIKENRQKGITLISLVVTIIILLILAGISIGMLSGDNSVLRQAGNAKKQTDIAGEKEILQISAVSAMGKHKYGDVTKEKLDNELDKNIGNANYSSELVDDGIEVTFTNSGRTYIVDSNGNVEKKIPSIEITEAKVVTNSNGIGEDVTANSKIEGTDTLYISFKPTISGGNITSVIYNENTIIPQNGIYVLEVSENGDYSFTINATSEGNNISTPYTKNVDKYQLWGGIEIGDYVTYVPPTNNGTVKSYSLTAGASGYTSDQTLTQQYNIWRVLNKNEDGTLDIMPAFNKADLPSGTTTYTFIYFQGAKGWNNEPYLLDDMCSYLYADEDNGITARSIDYEDITSRMIEGVEGESSSASTGLKKIIKYQSEEVAKLKTGTYIQSVNKSTNTVTYKTVTSHPTSYFDVKDDLSNPYYTSSTIDTDSSTNGIVASKPASLPVKLTFYGGTIESSDFTNSNAYNVIFGTGINYLLGSRCMHGNKLYVHFFLRSVIERNIGGTSVFWETGNDNINSWVSPIVTLSSGIKVTKCSGANSQTNRHTVVISN